MSEWIAALPMYDWPERRAEVDAEWVAIRDRLRVAGIDAPEALTRDFDDLHELWQRPDLLFAQTCWGPMELGLAEHVQVIGRPSYDGIEGGQGELYSSAIVMRADAGITYSLRVEVAPTGAGEGESAWHRLTSHPTPARSADPPPQGEGDLRIPLDLLRNARFVYNSSDSMSGLLGLARDLKASGESLDIFSERIESGGHRNSIRLVAEGRADVAAIDCMSWHLAKLYEPGAQELQVVGWTSLRKGLPFVSSQHIDENTRAALAAALAR